MSLVEDAMRKLQQTKRSETTPAGTAVPLRPDQVFGTVVNSPTGAYRALRTIQIDQKALREAGLLPPAHQERAISTQYRQIKRPLISNAMGRGVPRMHHGNLIMMASAVPGEGKTFTSLNLALSMTLEKDMRVLLVDADLPKPHISTLLGVQQEPGLLNALHDSSHDLEKLVLATNIPGLFILPAGQNAENATELLASDRMRELCTKMVEHDPKRIILFDSPPLLLTTESQALAQVVGQIVIVVRAGVTPRRTVLDAVDCLGEGRPISLILNQSTATPNSGYYYYGYGQTQAQAAGREQR